MFPLNILALNDTCRTFREYTAECIRRGIYKDDILIVDKKIVPNFEIGPCMPDDKNYRYKVYCWELACLFYATFPDGKMNLGYENNHIKYKYVPCEWGTIRLVSRDELLKNDDWKYFYEESTGIMFCYRHCQMYMTMNTMVAKMSDSGITYETVFVRNN